jgi:hypothetical protein
MLNICRICQKVIDNKAEIGMLVMGVYDQIPSVNSFRIKQSTLRFVPNTMVHVECMEEQIEDYLDD